MLTIDWKERLKKDTEEFVANKLPHGDYDFEIIYKAYPARINGKIPGDVIAFVVQSMATNIGRDNQQYLPFYKYLWEKKGEDGKHAFCHIISKFIPKKPELYFPLVESALATADQVHITMILDKILLPLIKKNPETYLQKLFKYIQDPKEDISKQAMSACLRLIKKDPEFITAVVAHFVHQWSYPITRNLQNHVALLKTLAKLDYPAYLEIYKEYGNSRDPQTVEILCGAICDYDEDLYPIVERWTHSGNARLKKAAVSAFKILNKKK